MPKETITAKVTEGGEVAAEAAVEYNLPDNVQGYVDWAGEPVILSKLHQKIVIDLQAYMRGLIRAGKNDEDIAQAVANWKPGMARPGKSKKEKVKDAFHKMSADEKREMLAELRKELG